MSDFRERLHRIQSEAQMKAHRIYGNQLSINLLILDTIKPVLSEARCHIHLYATSVVMRSADRTVAAFHAPVMAIEFILSGSPQGSARLEYHGDPITMGITRTFAVEGHPLDASKLVSDTITRESLEADVERLLVMIVGVNFA